MTFVCVDIFIYVFTDIPSVALSQLGDIDEANNDKDIINKEVEVTL